MASFYASSTGRALFLRWRTCMTAHEVQFRQLSSTPVSRSRVSVDAIRELRRRTGAPIGAVKKALVQQEGDLESAIDFLRKLGASMVAKKAHREASEGLIGIAISGDRTSAAVVELNCETDFVARTPQFQHVVNAIAESALTRNAGSSSCEVTYLDPDTLLSVDENKDAICAAVSSLGENIVLKQGMRISLEKGKGSVFGYTHGAVGNGNGRIGVLVAVDGSGLEAVGPRLAMHIAAASPRYISIGSIPPEESARERSVLLDTLQSESKLSGKPKPVAILEKIVEGRLKKWYSSVVLDEQEMLVEAPFFSGKPRTVQQYIASEAGGGKVLSMARLSIGGK